MRLDRFICKSTCYSREQANKLIVEGRVQVNGDVVLVARTQVHENNSIRLDGALLKARPFRYLMVHKPKAMVCSNIDEVYPSVFNCLDVDSPEELHVAGRLDADTTGLVLVTDDGRWSFNIISPKYRCDKVYRVALRDPITKDAALALEQGVQLQGEDRLTLPAKVECVSEKEVLLTITEGKYHQVKRMFAAVGNRVEALHREQIGRLKLDVGIGQWRYLSDEEIRRFSIE